MVSKNNLKNKLQQDAKRVPHYGLRKLSVGVASVLLSTTLYFGVSANASTDVPAGNDGQTTEQADQSTTATKQNAMTLSQDSHSVNLGGGY